MMVGTRVVREEDENGGDVNVLLQISCLVNERRGGGESCICVPALLFFLPNNERRENNYIIFTN
jgi:hypothetical protein